MPVATQAKKGMGEKSDAYFVPWTKRSWSWKHTPAATLRLGKAVAENVEQNKLQNREGMQKKS